MNNSSNKRIVKNTSLLYFRMLLTMLVSLYTVRVVLKTLGVVDYGIYSVVGGIVEMFSFLSNTMASASERFFAFELGRNNIIQLKRTFSLTVTIYFGIAIVVFAFAETLGIWFLNNRMVIPYDRLESANWIFHFSIMSFVVTIMTIPYNSIIIARENMKFYAYVSIIEVVLKLVIVYVLVIVSVDKLKLYGFLIFLIICTTTFLYRIVCQRNYAESKFKFYWDSKLFKSLLTYSGWNLFGAVTGVANNQGTNILLNVFFGPVVNAARAIAFRVGTIVGSFSLNFYTAVTPQIVKSYASGENEFMLNLVFKSSRFSYYLLLVIALPIILECEFILHLWLKESSHYITLFTQLALIYALINSLENPLSQAVRATGNIRKYQVFVGLFTLLLLPVSYALFKSGFPPESTYYAIISIYSLALFIRLPVLKKLVNLSISKYLREVLWKIMLVTIISVLFPLLVKFYIGDGLLQFFIVSIFTVFWIIFVVLFFGVSKEERKMVFVQIKNRLKFNA